jgi:hypothetical protein
VVVTVGVGVGVIELIVASTLTFEHTFIGV